MSASLASVPSPPSSHLGGGTHLWGHWQGRESLAMHGHFEGLLEIDGDLWVGPGASVRGELRVAGDVDVEGQVDGWLVAGGRLRLCSGSGLRGRARAAGWWVSAAAVVTASLQQEAAQAAPSRAVVASQGAGISARGVGPSWAWPVPAPGHVQVGADATFCGRMTGAETVHIDGQVCGEVQARLLCQVRAGASLQAAMVQVPRLAVTGRFAGRLSPRTVLDAAQTADIHIDPMPALTAALPAVAAPAAAAPPGTLAALGRLPLSRNRGDDDPATVPFQPPRR
ncbi:MAG: polymer-forming cytoskeletal protein [Polyangiales bacterium]